MVKVAMFPVWLAIPVPHDAIIIPSMTTRIVPVVFIIILKCLL
jgi:hypothetical protein